MHFFKYIYKNVFKEKSYLYIKKNNNSIFQLQTNLDI